MAPDLGGETRSDLGGQRDRDDNRGQFTGVGNRGQHAGERGHPDKLEAPVGLDAQHHRRGQRHREDDPDGAAAGQQGVRAEADLADLTEYMLAVLGERKGDRCDSADVESDVLTEGDEAVARGSQGSARLTCSNNGDRRATSEFTDCRNDYGVERGQHCVHDEDERERDDHGFVDCVGNAAWATFCM